MTDITIAQAGTWPTYRLTLTRSGPLPQPLNRAEPISSDDE